MGDPSQHDHPPERYPFGPVPKETRLQLRLSLALNKVLETAKEKPLTLGMIIDTTQERAFGVVMAFLCLPFLLPFSIPGTSTPFGISLMLLGVQLAYGKNRPWLPKRLRNWLLPQKFAAKLIAGLAKLFKPLENFVRPRLLFMQNPASMTVIGIALVLDGFYLSLPWPPFIPLSNTIPAWMALIKIVGITEEDGIMLLAGTILSFAVAAASIIAIIFGWESIVTWWQGAAATLPATLPASMPASMPASFPSSIPATSPAL